MKKVYWLEKANNDLEQIYNFISQDSIYYAIKTINSIYAKTEIIMLYPYIGRAVLEIDNKMIREYIYKSYRIIYKIDSDIILILRVWHSARKFSKETIKNNK